MNLRTRRQWTERTFGFLCLIATAVGVILLALLLWDVYREGAMRLSWEFLESFPSRFPEKAGVKSALWGSIWLMLLTALFAIPVGIGAAIYLEEYASKRRLTRLIELNISNLAGNQWTTWDQTARRTLQLYAELAGTRAPAAPQSAPS